MVGIGVFGLAASIWFIGRLLKSAQSQDRSYGGEDDTRSGWGGGGD